MQKNSITNKISPCCNLPFSVMYWYLKNIKLNSENDRQFIISKLSQNGNISTDGWKVLINSGTLEGDAILTKAEFLEWFDCGKQPTCAELKLIIEGFKVGNWTPETELPLNIATVDEIANGQTLIGNTYTKEQTDDKIDTLKSEMSSGIKGNATQSNAPTTYSAETYPNGLFERYIVSSPITSPNSWGNIAVTQSELDANYIFFNVNNGVVSKELKPTTDSRDKMFRDSQFVSNGSAVLNSLGQIISMSVKWSDGVIGNLTNSNYNDFVIEYEKTTVTYNTITVVYDSTFDANGNTINKNITIL